MTWRCLTLLALGLVGPVASAQVDDRLRVDGGVDTYVGLQLAVDPDFLAARSRAELGVAFEYENGRVMVRPRLTHDVLTDEQRVELREAFGEVFFPRVDVRVGHQLIVWGRAQGLFVTDLIAPLDLSEFVAQPVEDLRLPLTAALATVYLGDAELTIVLAPRHPRTRIPDADSPWFPAPPDIAGLPVVFLEPADMAERGIDRAESALRLTWRGLVRTDIALLWVNGFNRVPAFRRTLQIQTEPLGGAVAITPAYERRQVLGLVVETGALNPFIAYLEAAYHSRHLFDEPIRLPTQPAQFIDPAFLDALGRGFLISKPFLKVVTGAERTFGVHLLGTQLVGRWVIDHDERVAVDAFEPAITGLWLARFFRDDLSVRLFGIYNVGHDFWITPEASYLVQDGLHVAAGAHLFGGRGPSRDDVEHILRDPTLRYSVFRENRFAYVRVQYRF